ncbi:MAG: hypothetical protein Q9M26_06750 [Mariprofundales bacterium]|nr:hypothetical protein [Mariprofundales bacterium]
MLGDGSSHADGVTITRDAAQRMMRFALESNLSSQQLIHGNIHCDDQHCIDGADAPDRPKSSAGNACGYGVWWAHAGIDHSVLMRQVVAFQRTLVTAPSINILLNLATKGRLDLTAFRYDAMESEPMIPLAVALVEAPVTKQG